MAWTPTTFVARWPEFAPTLAANPSIVQSALDEAARRCDVRVFATRMDDAVGLMAAHLLAISPYGEQSRLDTDKAETTYNIEWKRLAKMAAGGAWAVGIGPTAPLRPVCT